MTDTTETRDIAAAIDTLVAHVDQIVAEHFARSLPNLTPPTHRANPISDKWCRIEVIESGVCRSVYCFVALRDNETKTLGAVRQGDIHKSATFKAPAKIARGNVFAPDWRNCLTVYGAVYIK